MIDVREHVEEVKTEKPFVETLVRTEPDKHGAFGRLDSLKRALYDIDQTVNSSDISNTSDEWHKSYACLTKALIDFITCETKIIEL